MSKFNLVLADGTAKDYSRKIDATRAGEKAGQFRLTDPKGNVLVDTIELAPVAPIAAPAKPAKAPAKATAPKPARDARTWLVSGPDATHKCAGACGEVKPGKAFPTTKVTGQRGVECRTCRDARTTK